VSAPTLNAGLLERLREAGGPVAVEALGGDTAAVLADLRALEGFGFRLAWHPYGGVAYAGPARRLCPDQIEHGLGTSVIGRRIAVWDRVASTNDIAARAAATSAANEGLVVLAERQTAGRGRRGRSWDGAAGRSILMSVVLRPPTGLGDVAWLTALGAVAAAEVVEAAGVGAGRVRIKWPNDVYVGERKVAGVLVERGAGAVVGIGLNTSQRPEEFPEELRGRATSIAIEAGMDEPDRSELARALIRALDANYVRAQAAGPGALAAGWRERLGALGQAVDVRTVAGAVSGRLVDADLVAGLLIEGADGLRRRVAPAEVLSFDGA
jgi:BirA family biotin operon repressor/biotin-[acetyl-CoA-carboxylase] ligase